MILITDIEYEEIPEDMIPIRTLEKIMTVDLYRKEYPLDELSVDVYTEIVRGRRYVNIKEGIDVVIGMPDRIGKLLGVQIKAFNELDRQLKESQESYMRCSRQLNSLKNAGILERVKWLFSGVKLYKEE